MRTKSMKQVKRLNEFKTYYKELSETSEIVKTDEFIQHGSTTRLLHSVAVAYYSYRLALLTGFEFQLEDMVRGALLHDYFLYDAQDGDPLRKGHWVNHPKIALDNAEKELTLSEIEGDIIARHMFPLTIQPPSSREGVMVSLVDKCCSVYEFFSRKEPYQNLRVHVVGKASALPKKGSFVPKSTISM